VLQGLVLREKTQILQFFFHANWLTKNCRKSFEILAFLRESADISGFFVDT
jgi:hypothetical protein